MKNAFENQVSGCKDILTPAEKIIKVTNDNHYYSQEEAQELLAELSALTIKVESELHWHGDTYLKSLVNRSNDLINKIVASTRKQLNN